MSEQCHMSTHCVVDSKQTNQNIYTRVGAIEATCLRACENDYAMAGGRLFVIVEQLRLQFTCWRSIFVVKQ